MHIGILGAGQLGRMLALRGYPLGYQFSFLDKVEAPCAQHVGTYYQMPQFDTIHLDQFLNNVDVVTFETENISLDIATYIANKKPLYPNLETLKVTQNRIYEKNCFTQLKIPTTPYMKIENVTELQLAKETLGFPFLIKTATEGYDGKGQLIVHNDDEMSLVFQKLSPPFIAEKKVFFKRELSIIAARNQNKNIHFYPLTENYHQQGILRWSFSPATASAELQAQAQSYLSALMEHLDSIGVVTLELFETLDGKLLANEIAPRVHNSGHFSLEGSMTCQFENHLRAITNLPLGSTQAVAPTGMLNFIGQIPLPIQQYLQQQGAHLHLYDKTEKPNRKIGHVNFRVKDQTEWFERLKQFVQPSEMSAYVIPAI